MDKRHNRSLFVILTYEICAVADVFFTILFLIRIFIRLEGIL